MMNDALCTYDGRRDEVLVAYLYEDIEPAEREVFERHLAGCLPCRTELDALSDVRVGLAEWAAPETAAGIGGTAPRAALRIVNTGAETERPKPGGWRVLADAPLWMQAAAAMLVVAASLGLANINVTISRQQGLTLTTGWLGAPSREAIESPRPAGSVTPVAAADETRELREQVVALRQELSQLKAQPVAVDAKAVDAAVTRQVQAQLQERDRRLQREISLQIAEMGRDFQVQRQSDLARVDRVLGVYQNRTGMQVMQQQQQLNNLLQRVSEQR